MNPFDNANNSFSTGGQFNNAQAGLNAMSIHMQNMNSSMAGATGTEMSALMRSLKDSLTFSFQTLNMTLSSLQSSMTNLGTKIGNLSPGTFPQKGVSNWMPGGAPNLYLGSMPATYANLAGNLSYTQLLGYNSIPYNQSQMGFWADRNRDLTLRTASLGSSMLAAGTSEALSYGSMLYAGGKIGGALGLGGGLLGGLGKLAIGAPIGMAVGAAADLVLDPMVKFAQQHNETVANVQRMSARFRTPFSLRESQRVATGLEDAAYQEMFNTDLTQSRMNLSGFKDVMNVGLQGHLFHGTNPDELVDQIKTASHIVKFLAGVMGSKDVKETMELMVQLKNMGVNPLQMSGYVRSLGIDAMKYGRSLGMQPDQLMNDAANMSAATFGAQGLPAFAGMRSAIQNIAYTQELEKRGILTPAEIAAAGGTQAIATNMLNTKANLMKNPAVGGAMMFAGLDANGKFSAANLQGAMAGGFWNTFAQASANVLGDGSYGIARYLTQQQELIAQMEAGPEGADPMIVQHLKNLVEQNIPGYNRNRSADDNVMLAQAYFMQTLGMGNAEAKAWATKIFKPSVERAVRENANMQSRLGYAESMAQHHSMSRFGQSIYEGVERIGAGVYHNLVERPARYINDSIANATNFAYENDALAGNLVLTDEILAKYRQGERDLSGFLTPDRAYSAADYASALQWGNRPDSFLHMGNRFVNYVGAFFGGPNLNELEDKLSVNIAADNADLWDRITGEDRMTKMEAIGKHAGFFRGAGVKEEDFNRIADKYSENAQANTPIQMAAEMISELSGNKEGIVRGVADTLGMWGPGIASEAGREQVVGQIVSDRADRDTFKQMSANDVYNMLGESRFQENLQRLAKQKNMSMKQLRGQIALQASKSGWGSVSEENRIAMLYAGGRGEMLEDFAEAFASENNADLWGSADKEARFNTNIKASTAMLEKLGFSAEDIAGMTQADQDAILEEIRMIQANPTEVVTEGDITTVKARGLGKDQIKSLLYDDNGKLKVTSKTAKAMQRISEMDAYELGGILGSQTEGAQELKRAFATGNMALARGSLSTQMASLGIHMTSEEISDFLGGDWGSRAEKFLKMKPANEEVANIQGQISQIMEKSKGMSDADFVRAYGEKYGFTEETLKKEGGRNRVFDMLTMQGIAGQGEKAEQKEAKAATEKKTAIDSAVETNAPRPYVVVQEVNKWAETARSNMTTDAEFESRYKGGMAYFNLSPRKEAKSGGWFSNP